MNKIKSLWQEHSLSSEKHIIKTRLGMAGKFKCDLATNQLTGQRIFIIEFSKKADGSVFKSIKFRGLAIQLLDFDTHKELTILLLDSSLEDIFISFIDNILEETGTCTSDNEALGKIHNVISRWKKLFDKAGFNGLTAEEEKGLLGELLVLNSLLDEGYPGNKILDAWDGPDKRDKDFLFGLTGIEVKLTSSKYPSLKITNERQLDGSGLSHLYLFLFVAEEVREAGLSLISLARDIREKLKDCLATLDLFNEKLKLLRFDDEDQDHYSQQYVIKNQNKYLISDDFPKIVSSVLPHGIYNVSYSIELSACESHIINSGTIRELIDGY